MSGKRQKLCVLLDAGVPDSVGRTFQQDGHVVFFHRDVLPERTPDHAVCVTAIENDAILVAIDGDMKQLPKRYGKSLQDGRYEKLNIIRLCCNEVMAAKRLQQALPLIEMEWEFANAKPSRRMWIDIREHVISTHR